MRLRARTDAMKRWNAAKAKKKLDVLWSRIIHERDDHCRFCGRTEGMMNAHHVFSRRHTATRWDVRNGVLVCFSDHYRAHNDIPWGHMMAIQAIGQPEFDMLDLIHEQIVHFDRAYYAAKLVELQKLVAGGF